MEPRYCAAPWRGLHINPRGDIKTCCAGDPNMLGNLNSSTITQILQSKELQEIRSSIRQGILHPEYCHNCIEAERYGRSERHWHNDVNPDFTSQDANLESHLPSIVDVRWNTTCNLSCNYCGPKCSSRWAALTKEPYDTKTRRYFDQVCEYIDQHREHVREVALVGGEPLLLKENERLLEVIPDSAIVTLITNITTDFDTNPIVKKLEKRSRVGWSMSFENIGPRFEYVRSGGFWYELDHNVQKVSSYIKNLGHWGGIHAVYNIYSATRLCELRRYAATMDLDILWQTLYQPDYLDPVKHNTNIRELCQQEIYRYHREFGFTDSERSFFDPVLKTLEIPRMEDPMISQNFRDHIHDIEHKYHKHDFGRFRELWPEYNNKGLI